MGEREREREMEREGGREGERDGGRLPKLADGQTDRNAGYIEPHVKRVFQNR